MRTEPDPPPTPWNWPTARERCLREARRYTRSQLRRVLVDAGLDVLEMRRVNPVGALGWLVAGRVLRRSRIPERPLIAYDRFVPLLRAIDRIDSPVGLSLWAAARRP